MNFLTEADPTQGRLRGGLAGLQSLLGPQTQTEKVDGVFLEKRNYCIQLMMPSMPSVSQLSKCCFLVCFDEYFEDSVPLMHNSKCTSV